VIAAGPARWIRCGAPRRPAGGVLEGQQQALGRTCHLRLRNGVAPGREQGRLSGSCRRCRQVFVV
jgi:hypothetical protein